MILCLAVGSAPLANVRADSLALPTTYTQVTKNGQFLFVMLGAFYPEKLRDKYPGSGLYKNDGSTTPLWRVDWFAYAVYVSSDGKHMARHGDWPSLGDQGRTRAVTFYRDGTEIKTYRVNELVPDPGAMPRSVSHYQWHRPWVFDGERNRLTITTLEAKGSPGRTYVFDLSTGEIVGDASTETKP
jgi:hypothetical protein